MVFKLTHDLMPAYDEFKLMIEEFVVEGANKADIIALAEHAYVEVKKALEEPDPA